MNIPSAYLDGYEKARKKYPELADAYILHTTTGDPLADRVVEELAPYIREGKGQEQEIIEAAFDKHGNPPESTPPALRELIAATSVVPDWFDPKLAEVATRAFLRNPEIILAALATGAIVEGFSTLISKSFRIRGRLLDNGVRRLKQNNLQLFEQFMPGGLNPGCDGWRLNLRIRLVHAQARSLVRTSSEWDEAQYGLPLNAAHMLLGAACFSGRLMQHVARLGGGFSEREREAYVHVWRYSGFQMGIPQAISFHDEASAIRIYEVGALCEPPPDDDAILMANSIINSTPVVLDVTESSARRREAGRYYQLSRELIGNELADRFRFPPARKIPLLPLIALKYRAMRQLVNYMPRWFSRYSIDTFNRLIEASDLGQYRHDYRLPSSLFDEDSKKW